MSYVVSLDTLTAFIFKSIERILWSGAFTLHGEEKDGVPSLDKIPALGSEVGEIYCCASAWSSEILGTICICDLNTHLARVVPEKHVRACLKECINTVLEQI